MTDAARPPFVVVVAEDEVILRMLAIDELTDAGFIVIEAAHAGEALALLEDKATDIHILFTDIHMPGGTLDGLELAHHTHRHWPWIGLLVASGLARPIEAELPPGGRFLPKPYDCNHMVEHVRQLAAVKARFAARRQSAAR